MHMLDTWRSQLVSIVGAADSVDGAHDLNHLHRVWQNAQILLQDYPEADALVVLAAVYLHDIVNLAKDHPQRHFASRLAAKQAEQILIDLNFPADRLARVSHAIEAHSFSAAIVPSTIEAQIVQDADRLDALGAVGLARLYYTAGRLGRALAHPADPLGLERELNDKAYALDHIEIKLAGLPASMSTAAGRQLGEQRLAWLRAFQAAFVSEWGVHVGHVDSAATMR